ncbi:acyl-ACP--UDP-N-acetylglucosamine O-acyltransferase [Bacteriovorax sp. Seq25_V]|uniref:acyl-ACP--UDP-N-acetylglucosamine O-acyltransferase n=1 Tax=Bacteriovorax sp. Seq25_V TaxID=1201288 RepID=UPI00038A3884|nr:acyl-ACP--UDP-N-acetylglucosamine O-acyltransferase [Bacteriovorax sp. Seq25_V]EQC47615.1 acyl-[acyl-carrier-protein]-UDP-N-acetylglucosamine O-acyltransferase [Bacteriovorax sp. Seq25_V]
MANIHPTAIIAEGAKLGENVEVGPYSIIGPNVEIGDNCKIRSHVLIDGHTIIGKNNDIFQYSSIGAEPQDTSYKGEPTRTVIGDNNTFREYVSIHRGTLKDKEVTTIGSNCLFMAHVHVGHDGVVGNNVILVNSVNLAGHVIIGDRVIIGGGTNISQFVTLGRGAYIGGASAIDRDVPIFCTAYGNRIKLKGINIIGLRRQGYEKSVISELVDFYRTMESSVLSPRAFIDHEELMEDYKDNVLVQEMRADIRKSEIGIAPFVK